MKGRTTMAKLASTHSLRMRALAHAKPWQAIDVFDLAKTAGVEVRFAKIASMEGMYLRRDAPVILVASERPAGRQRFTCAHEMAHHVFGDGSRVDEMFDENRGARHRGDEELRADMFAGLLLMPKTAVLHAFTVRGLSIATATAEDVFRVSCWLGVGYTTLLKHLKYALHLIADDRYGELMRRSPKEIRESLLGADGGGGELVIADEHWDSRPIDLKVGDVLLAPSGAEIEGAACTVADGSSAGTVVIAAAPGVARIEAGRWASFVRVCRRGFEGRSVFRHLEEAGDE